MRLRRRVAAVAVACCAAGVAASPAAGRTYELSGTQVPVDEASGYFFNYGQLLGVWQVTSFSQLAVSPLFHATGTEEFHGCLNLNRDGYCYKEPTGTLKFTFDFWAKFAADGSELWGACTHPIVSGDRGFAGADGIVTMIDSQTERGIHTRWQGVLILPDTPGAAAQQARLSRHRLSTHRMLRQWRNRRARTTVAARPFCGA
jgi:hypothetical protein